MEKVSGYESDAIHRSVGPGLYQTNNLKNAEVYPWAPTMILQKNGGSVDKENVKDIESDLFNMCPTLASLGSIDAFPIGQPW